MRVLLTGAGGFLGQATVKSLIEHGHQVRAMIRPASRMPEWPQCVEIFKADLRIPSDYEGVFEDVDAVIHLAAAVDGNEDQQFASTVIATEKFLDALVHSRVRQLIHISTIAHYDWQRIDSIMDENCPISSDVYALGAYSMAKYWQEKIIMEAAVSHQMRLTIMRPGFVWGQNHARIAGMGRTLGPIHFMFSPLSRLPLTYVENCADCLVFALDNQNEHIDIYNVFDNDSVRTWGYCKQYFRGAKERKIIIPIPYYLGLGLAKVARITSRLIFGPRGRLPSFLDPVKYESQFKPIRFSTRKLQDNLGWRPKVDFATALNRTFRDKT